ncbi:hypothetical protein NOGI109294_22440 [Nocardiopsis gilva]
MADVSLWRRTRDAITGADRVHPIRTGERSRDELSLGTRTMAAILGRDLPPAVSRASGVLRCCRHERGG